MLKHGGITGFRQPGKYACLYIGSLDTFGYLDNTPMRHTVILTAAKMTFFSVEKNDVFLSVALKNK